MYIHTLSKTVVAIALLLTISNAQLKPKENRAPIITKDGTTIAFNDDIKRRFPHARNMEPILGYIRHERGGQKGLEKYADRHLKNGYTMHLTIDYPLQENIVAILDRAKEELQADEILAAVMDSGTGKVLAMASSNRYNPAYITADDVPSLTPKVAEYPYEPGSIIKPLTLAIALDHQQLYPDTILSIHNGTLKVGDKTITDDEKFPALSATDIIVHSSNVGISQISWLLTSEEFRDGLQSFGLGSHSGIDLSRDLPGKIKPVELLDDKMHRANTSYGYGMHATFSQLLKAYSAFNNDGITVTPRIVDYFTDKEGAKYTLKRNAGRMRAVSDMTADQIHNILIEVVKRGTGLYAAVPGLEIGGKTGTAHIAQNGKYLQEYNSSFYGFANDSEGHKYTIGVLVIKAKKENSHFASQSAAPVSREIVEAMVERGYLVPESGF